MIACCLLAPGAVLAQIRADVPGGGAGAATGEPIEREDTTARYQVTYNWQRHGAFASPYSAANSLRASADRMYTFSATAHWGRRLWEGGEIYFNPEVVQGIPFSGALVGLGGFTNGEITRAAGAAPSAYRQRLFVRQVWNQGGGTVPVEGDFNQLAGSVDRDRVVLTAGNFSTLDVFDDNAYAKDPRTQFMNWAHWTYAAYDYAADARGFGWGATLEWYRDNWAVRVGRMSGPKRPNELATDTNIGRHYGDQIEVERAHKLFGEPGRVRVLAWRNRANLASWRDALGQLQAVPAEPQAFFAVRNGAKVKHGLGVNLEQQLGPHAGAFLRAMKADGRTETWAFTEVDESLSAGVLVQGTAWGRERDSAGLAYMRNALSRDRRRYLEAGGITYFIGDGRLNYRPEAGFEAFYSLGVMKNVWLTGDWQRIANPAYNADRGPVNVLALRVHLEY